MLGWEAKGAAAGAPAIATPQIDVDAFDSVEELETLGEHRHMQHACLELWCTWLLEWLLLVAGLM